MVTDDREEGVDASCQPVILQPEKSVHLKEPATDGRSWDSMDSKTWTLSKSDETFLAKLERKML